MQIGCQVYVKNSIEAVKLYQRAFGWTIGMNFMNPDNGTYAHASLMFGECEMLAVAEDGGNRPKIQCGVFPVMSFNCCVKSKEAVDQAYKVLSENAHATGNPSGPNAVPWNEYCFTLVDKFGVLWWVAI